MFKLRRICRSPWPRDLRRMSAAARPLRLWVRIPPVAWMSVRCECCVLLSVRGLCDELITRPVESYRLWCVVVCYLETSWMRRAWPSGSCCARKKQTVEEKLRSVWWSTHRYCTLVRSLKTLSVLLQQLHFEN